MHTWEEKSLKKDTLRGKKSENPSFSSTLLDEIYRSIDKKESENQANRNEVREKINTLTQDEEMNKLRRACLIDKWIEKKANGKKSFIAQQGPPQDYDNDSLFFSSSSISSDTSSGGLSSSSETEYFSAEKTRKSCFVTPWPKPIRTKVKGLNHHPQECQSQSNQAKTDTFIRSRSRAMKIYANLKNVKQPISPGGRLTSFISSIFTNASPKQSKSSNLDRKSKSTQTSACSSAASFSRSCLSKTQHDSKVKINHENAKRTVSFYVDPPKMKIEKMQGIRDNNGLMKNVERSNFEDDEEDAASDCSSDLFEIDHLVLFRNDRFCEELPVYETTHLNKNHAIASGMVR